MRVILFVLLAGLLIFAGCSANDDDDNSNTETVDSIMDLDVEEDFDYSAEKEVSVEINLRDTNDDGIPGVVYDLYYIDQNQESKFIRNNMTNSAGRLNTVLTIPSYVENVKIAGFMNNVELPIAGNEVDYNFSMYYGDGTRGTSGLFTVPERGRSFSYLDSMTYSQQGVPYRYTNYPISTEMLLRVDTSLPESVSLLISHPQYLGDDVTTNFVITDSSNVWITFVTEGAGYKNGLGFYTYDYDEGPPADPEDLEHILIFPNVSLQGSGGGLNPGMTVYLGQFGAGTVMGWFLVQNGWISGANVSETAERFYSDSQYNPDQEGYKQHQVLLYDAESELFLVAFDDQLRPNGGDQDFNDAVFFATADPIENIDTTGMEPIDIPVDSDDDGVNDPFDEYPDDDERAFFVFYPAENETATLVYEDEWPHYGDYDMNDMVLDYSYQLVTNADDEVKDIFMDFSLRAAGAFYDNGFSVLIPYEYSNLDLVESSENIFPALVHDGDYTIVDFFQSYSNLTSNPAGAYFNTEPDQPYLTPVDFSVKLTLDDPVSMEDLDFSFPYNPFIRRQGNETHEIHLMGFPASNRHNTELYQTEDDDSDPDNDRYFVSPLNLPWGLNLPQSWDYPLERASIVEAYLNFSAWAESGGEVNQDWYLNTPEQTNPDKIYQTP